MNSDTLHENINGAGSAALPKRKYVITLIHGTFAGNASWMRSRSLFRAQLRTEIPDPIVFKVFKWGYFNNSPRARSRATSDLQKRLKRTLLAHPDAIHVVIGHSHGGNVALQALKDPILSARIAAVVCLATPFIAARPRNLRFALGALCFLILAVPLWPITILISWVVQLIWEPIADGLMDGSVVNLLVVLFVAYFILFKLCPLVFRMWVRAITWLYGKVAPRIINLQQTIVEKYRMPQYAADRVLWAPVENDEVRIWLKILGFPVSVLFWLVRPSSIAVNVAVILLALFGAFGSAMWVARAKVLDGLAELVLVSFFAGGSITGGFVNLILQAGFGFLLLLVAFTFAGALASWIEILLLQPFFLLVPILFRGTPIAYGWEGLRTNWLTSLAVYGEPPAAFCAALGPLPRPDSSRTRVGLRHSIYNDRTRVTAMAKWLCNLKAVEFNSSSGLQEINSEISHNAS
jgi:hypothetical protein